MKRQYLGDSKDSFTWDYHDYLVSELGYSLLNIALMMTPDDGSNDGQTPPALFPARSEIIDFCHEIRQLRSIRAIKALPEKSGARYKVSFHKNDTYLSNNNRAEYFSHFDNTEDQIVFLDPDNGFEPEKTLNEKHVSYRDISNIIEQLANESIVSVFQHHRRISFPNDFARIKDRLESGHATAIYWHSLMFVTISKSEKAIKRVLTANELYAKNNPVTIIA